MCAISRFDGFIDSRDIIERIEELSEYKEQEIISEEEADELEILKKIANTYHSYGDWEHGETLIRYDKFQDHAQEIAESCGMVPDSNHWPLYCIDWEKAAEELKQDYVEIDFDGVSYFMRA